MFVIRGKQLFTSRFTFAEIAQLVEQLICNQ